MRYLFALTLLAACDDLPSKTPEGCQIYMTPEMQQLTAACQAGYYEEIARQNGQPVTRCFRAGDGAMSCTTH